jgi:hypothetical protein
MKMDGVMGTRVDPARLDTALDAKSQLPAQEEIFGVDRFGRTGQQHHPAQGVFDHTQGNPDDGDHALIVPQRSPLNLRDAAPRRTAFLRRTRLRREDLRSSGG